MNKSYKVAHAMLAWLVKLIFRVHVAGLENEPTEGGILLCSNHVSLIDPICICAVLKKTEPLFMAKKELFKVPLLRHIIRAFGAYPVNRGAGDIGAVRKTIALLKEGNCTGIFPQGTRCKGKTFEETKFKTGAALVLIKSGVPALPVRVKMKNNRWRFLRRIDIVIGKPITTEEIAFDPEKPRNEETERITNLLFEKINELGGDAK